MIRKLSSVCVFAHTGLVIRCCPMADSQLILALLFLQKSMSMYVKRMLPLFRAVVKFCTTNRLFILFYTDFAIMFSHCSGISIFHSILLNSNVTDLIISSPQSSIALFLHPSPSAAFLLFSFLTTHLTSS